MERLSVIAILLFFLIAAGCTSTDAQGNPQSPFGLKTVSQCDSAQAPDSQTMHCYGAAAITYAYAGDADNATATCGEIWRKFGDPIDPKSNNNMRDKASLSANSCYQNIAVILAQPPLCYYITQRTGPASELKGETTSQDLCLKQAQKQVDLQQYYSNPTNLCTMVFILPLLVFVAFWRSCR